MIDFGDELVYLLDLEELQSFFCEECLFGHAIVLSHNGIKAIPPYRKSASFVADDVSPSAGTKKLVVLGPVQRNRSGSRDDNDTGTARKRGFERDVRIGLNDNVLKGGLSFCSEREELVDKH